MYQCLKTDMCNRENSLFNFVAYMKNSKGNKELICFI